MLKPKITGLVQEVILPDFPDDDNTVTTTVTKSRRVSFGTNFVKEFIVGSAVSAQCIGEYEQAFPSSDSSNTDSSHSAAESEILDHSAFVPESHKSHKQTVTTVNQAAEPELLENRPKPPKFSSTICFSADSPTADMEFTEGCITLAKSILDKKNKEMTVIIQAKPKETKDEEKPKEDETKYFDASQFEMSVTKCLKSKENKREEKRFESEKTKIYSKFEDEMSITRCSKVFNGDESDSSWEDCKENRIPLDMIMRHLDKDNSDLENDLFNPEKSFNNLLNSNSFDFSNDSEELHLNESMDISADFQPNAFKNLQKVASEDPTKNDESTEESQPNISEKVTDFQPSETGSSETTNPNESKMPQSSLSEKIITEKSTELNISNKLNPDSATEISTEFQPQLNDSENVNTDEPMEICSEEAKTSDEIENPVNYFVVNNDVEVDDGAKQTLQKMEISSDIQQNVTEPFENPIELYSENKNVNESTDITANIQQNESKPPQNKSIDSEPDVPEESDEIREPYLVDVKVIESLKEQSKEPDCVWSLKDLRHPQKQTPGLLSFNCELLESTTTIQFTLKKSKENNLDSCSIVTNIEISLNEEKLCRLPEYELVIEFGFQELKNSFDDRQQKVETIRHIPYFLDQINSFLFKINSYLRQIHSILTLYPGSRLKGSILSFRLYSFPIFFSCVVSVDLTNLFRLSKSSLSFENDFGSLDENKIRKIFQECLKQDNSLCEFIIQSTKYLIELEKKSGYVSKRSHIRLLPVELKL